MIVTSCAVCHGQIAKGRHDRDLTLCLSFWFRLCQHSDDNTKPHPPTPLINHCTLFPVPTPELRIKYGATSHPKNCRRKFFHFVWVVYFRPFLQDRSDPSHTSIAPLVHPCTPSHNFLKEYTAFLSMSHFHLTARTQVWSCFSRSFLLGTQHGPNTQNTTHKCGYRC